MFQTKNEAVQAFYYQETSLVFNYTCTFLPKSEVVLTYLYRKTAHKREGRIPTGSLQQWK